MTQHITALRAVAQAASAESTLTAGMGSANYASALLSVGRMEEAGRLAIVNYTPRGDQEAALKLTYLAAYLIATGSTLTAHEMSSILQACRNRTEASVS